MNSALETGGRVPSAYASKCLIEPKAKDDRFRDLWSTFLEYEKLLNFIKSRALYCGFFMVMLYNDSRLLIDETSPLPQEPPDF